jgi:hypothetical protein
MRAYVLMNGDKHRLANICKLPEKAYGIEGSLSIKPRCRFVQEDEDRRFGNQLDTDSHTLALLDRKTCTNSSYQSMFQIVQLQKVDYGVYISRLLLASGIATLSKDGREL